MDVTSQDNDELEILKTVLGKIDALEREGTESIYTRIYENQPLILSMMMMYEDNVDLGNLDEEQFNDIRDLLFIVFLFFEEKTNISKAEVTQEAFQEKLELNLNFVNYLVGEDLESQAKLTVEDLEKMHFKSLYTTLTQMANDYNSFIKMDHNLRGAIFLEIKTLGMLQK